MLRGCSSSVVMYMPRSASLARLYSDSHTCTRTLLVNVHLQCQSGSASQPTDLQINVTMIASWNFVTRLYHTTKMPCTTASVAIATNWINKHTFCTTFPTYNLLHKPSLQTVRMFHIFLYWDLKMNFFFWSVKLNYLQEHRYWSHWKLRLLCTLLQLQPTQLYTILSCDKDVRQNCAQKKL